MIANIMKHDSTIHMNSMQSYVGTARSGGFTVHQRKSMLSTRVIPASCFITIELPVGKNEV